VTGFKLPTSENGVMKLVQEDYEDKGEHTSTIEDELNELLSSFYEEPVADTDFKSEFKAFSRTGTRTENLKSITTRF